MKPTLPQRHQLRDVLKREHHDWAGVRAKLETIGHPLSQSAINRYFAGTSHSSRTFNALTKALGTTPAGLPEFLRLDGGPSGFAAGFAASTEKPLRDPEAFRIAYQLWFEMGTRKIGEPIDPATDLIHEIYDSWYAFFKIARELAKTIPLHRDPTDPALRRLVQLAQAVLNHGLRPHLQRWQGKFRTWHTAGEPALAPVLTPQAAQALFPEWAALRDDLTATSRRLMTYHAALGEMIARPNAPKPPGSSKKSRRRKP